MRSLKRFCCGFAIFTGVQIIGYLNFVSIVFSLVINNMTRMYYDNAFIIFAIIDLIVFFKMMRNDSVQLRKKLYMWQFGTCVFQNFV